MSGSFECVRWNACEHRLDVCLYSHLKEFWGNEVRTHVNSKGKIPSTGKKISSVEDRAHDAASSGTASPKHYQRAIPAPSPALESQQPNPRFIFLSISSSAFLPSLFLLFLLLLLFVFVCLFLFFVFVLFLFIWGLEASVWLVLLLPFVSVCFCVCFVCLFLFFCLCFRCLCFSNNRFIRLLLPVLDGRWRCSIVCQDTTTPTAT